MKLQAVSNRKLYIQIANQIRDQILAGAVEAGQQLPSERDLALSLNVSRPTVREALIALETAGLVEVRVGVGAFVRDQSKAGAALPDQDHSPIEIMKVRLLLEPEAAAQASQNISDDGKARLALSIERMGADKARGVWSTDSDRMMHMTIADASGNSVLREILDMLWNSRSEVVDKRFHEHLGEMADVQAHIFDDHSAIVDAISAGDADRARERMTNHLDFVTAAMSESLGLNMQALRITRPGVAELTEIDVPVPGAGEVAIDVAYVGYCGSDLTSYRGLNPLVSYPRVPGHEISGKIAELGAGFEGLAIGQAVTVVPYFNCGHCKACRSGRPIACSSNQTMGVQREGAMTGRIVVPASKVLPVDDLALRDLALIEPCAVGFHAVRRAAVSRGETVLVLGCGMIGLGIIMGALRMGATVIAADLSPAKLEAAKALGASHVLKGGADLPERVRAIVAEGPDVVIEAVGAEATFLQAVEIVAPVGRVVYVGYAKAPIAYDTKVFLTKELDIRGSRNASPEDFEAVIDWLRSHPGAGDLVVSKTVPLTEAPQALEAWHQAPGDFTKVLVRMTA